MRPRVSVVIPAYNEGAEIDDCLDRILESVKLPCEVLVVYDTPEDTTAPYVKEYARRDHRVRQSHIAYCFGDAGYQRRSNRLCGRFWRHRYCSVATS